MALVPAVSPGHVDPSHSSSAGPSLSLLPNLALSPRLRRSPCRGRGGTCRPSSEVNPPTMCKVTASGFAEPGVAEMKKNNLDQDHTQLLGHIPDSY